MDGLNVKTTLINEGLGAMSYVLTLGGKTPLTSPQKEMLAAIAQTIFGVSVSLETLKPFSPDDIGMLSYDRQDSQLLMMCLSVLPYSEGVLSPEKQALVETYQDDLDIQTDSVKLICTLASQRVFVSEASILSGHALSLITGGKSTRAHHTWKNIRDTSEDKVLGQRYRALKDYAEDSLGHALYRFYYDNGLAYPGEKYGPVNGLGLLHDLAFILGGYQRNSAGRLLTAAFQAGFSRHYGLQFPLIAFMHYYNDSVIVPDDTQIKKCKLTFDVFKEAYQKGKSMSVDLYDSWDYWRAFNESLEKVRDTVGCYI
jgi:hypothetical protein